MELSPTPRSAPTAWPPGGRADKPIVLVTTGTRGDVQPYAALAAGMQRAGLLVRLMAPENFRGLAEQEAGVPFAPLRGPNPQELARDPAIQRAARRGSQLAVLLTIIRRVRPAAEQLLEACWEASADASALIASTIPFGIIDSAMARGIPAVHATLHALRPTRAFPNPFLAPFGIRTGLMTNRLTHQVVRQALWLLLRGALNGWRRRHQLAPHSFVGYYEWLDALRIPTIYGFSPAVLPPPADWPEWHHVTGYWFLDPRSGWQPPTDLERFIAAGPPPVSIGFGSMDDQNPARVTAVVLEALERCGQRAVLLAGWGGFGAGELPAGVLRIEAAPHTWLFPQMAAVVHHGGAGTTAAALRAGTPAVITPFAGDQRFWAARITRLRAGVRGEPFIRLTAEGLAETIERAAGDQRLRRGAAELGTAIRTENGVDRAVEVITAALGR